MKPHCHNRPPASDGAWHRHGYRASDLKLRLRWSRRQMSDRCAAYDTGDRAVPAPIRDGWECTGCRWLPAHIGDAA